MDNREFLDKLKRAFAMEEEMAGELINLSHPEVLPADLPEETRRRISGILLGIKADTLRHKKIVTEIIEDKI